MEGLLRRKRRKKTENVTDEATPSGPLPLFVCEWWPPIDVVDAGWSRAIVPSSIVRRPSSIHQPASLLLGRFGLTTPGVQAGVDAACKL